ncbi:uncharacterized protein LOC103575850 [Microplitis demolitor]|uniref:uncharacterized protein LOC103575850 n=1 Tax=Microplitis demolitor TaxID=69319 RepID=UPI00235B5F0B|nr:uncharacterized protein LOC103575850 [Microplitis demolitor]
MPIILPILFHTKTNTSDRLPIFQGYDVIFNAQVSPLYEIAFFFEHSLLRFKMLAQKFCISRTETPNGEMFNYSILYRFSNNIRKSLFELCLLEIGASTILFCIDEYCFLKMLEKNDFANMIPYLMLFAALNFNILVLCYFSELLDSQFAEIGIHSCMTEWYRFPLKIRKYLILIICMSQRSQKLTAGGIIDISYTTYVQIIKAGFTYLQLLRASNM